MPGEMMRCGRSSLSASAVAPRSMRAAPSRVLARPRSGAERRPRRPLAVDPDGGRGGAGLEWREEGVGGAAGGGRSAAPLLSERCLNAEPSDRESADVARRATVPSGDRRLHGRLRLPQNNLHPRAGIVGFLQGWQPGRSTSTAARTKGRDGGGPEISRASTDERSVPMHELLDEWETSDLVLILTTITNPLSIYTSSSSPQAWNSDYMFRLFMPVSQRVSPHQSGVHPHTSVKAWPMRLSRTSVCGPKSVRVHWHVQAEYAALIIRVSSHSCQREVPVADYSRPETPEWDTAGEVSGYLTNFHAACMPSASSSPALLSRLYHSPGPVGISARDRRLPQVDLPQTSFFNLFLIQEAFSPCHRHATMQNNLSWRLLYYCALPPVVWQVAGARGFHRRRERRSRLIGLIRLVLLVAPPCLHHPASTSSLGWSKLFSKSCRSVKDSGGQRDSHYDPKFQPTFKLAIDKMLNAHATPPCVPDLTDGPLRARTLGSDPLNLALNSASTEKARVFTGRQSRLETANGASDPSSSPGTLMAREGSAQAFPAATP
ncbi:hypothetical protein K488DRAFT_69982 [Vararia minispora EC-137]|uniref:Uncharacterized protein n=1 Tax=Vararia minispora EC-137 TaxID=1314806 RepID=A0ACB8QN51_9AGAM|nr:hypothetical protein K488DRAFT_69982 [Vararia minispora EC-137]